MVGGEGGNVGKWEKRKNLKERASFGRSRMKKRKKRKKIEEKKKEYGGKIVRSTAREEMQEKGRKGKIKREVISRTVGSKKEETN